MAIELFHNLHKSLVSSGIKLATPSQTHYRLSYTYIGLQRVNLARFYCSSLVFILASMLKLIARLVFQDPSVQQAARGGGRQGGLDDYNPFAEDNKTQPAPGVSLLTVQDHGFK